MTARRDVDRDGLVARVRGRIDALADGGPAGLVLEPGAAAEAAALLEIAVEATDDGGFAVVDVQALQMAAWLHWARFCRLPDGEDQADLQVALAAFALLHPHAPDAVPPEVAALLRAADGGDP
jgi:hypothetical protein